MTRKQPSNAQGYQARSASSRCWDTQRLRFLEPRPGEHFQDLDCGDGAPTREIVTAGHKVIGIDHSQAMLTATRGHGIDASATTERYRQPRTRAFPFNPRNTPPERRSRPVPESPSTGRRDRAPVSPGRKSEILTLRWSGYREGKLFPDSKRRPRTACPEPIPGCIRYCEEPAI